MSTAILTLSENGELQKIHDRWLKRETCASPDSDSDSNSDQLQLKSFWGLFLIFGIACSIALFLYFGMMLWEFGKHHSDPPEESPKSGSRSVRLQRFLSFADEKEEVSKSKLKRKRERSTINGTEVDSRNRSNRIQAEVDDEQNVNS